MSDGSNGAEVLTSSGNAQPRPRAIAVIGSNYGDEGKGATVHNLAGTTPITSVIRFNGGNQAGHTVQLKGGKRHVFSNFGSATLRHVGTHWANTALFNPVAMNKERNALKDLGYGLTGFSVDPETPLITPWDIALNQFLEHGRGEAKHGSCGMGIGETARRLATPGAPVLKAADCKSPELLFMKMVDLRAWFKKRVQEEADAGSFTYLNEPQKAALYDLILHPTRLMLDVYSYPAILQTVAVSPIRPENGQVFIFEGAQGLLLDEDDPDHQPHVSWSKTGINNVMKFCQQKKIQLTDIYYVTRPYLTRHGAGPIHAGIECENEWDVDLTNKANTFQGPLRHAHMDWGKWQARVFKDIAEMAAQMPEEDRRGVKIHMALTCMDQCYSSEKYRFIYTDKEGTDVDEMITPEKLVPSLSSMIGLPVHVVDGRAG